MGSEHMRMSFSAHWMSPCGYISQPRSERWLYIFVPSLSPDTVERGVIVQPVKIAVAPGARPCIVVQRRGKPADGHRLGYQRLEQALGHGGGGAVRGFARFFGAKDRMCSATPTLVPRRPISRRRRWMSL